MNPDRLTVLVFKDNLSSRTFTVPFSWIRRIGILLGLLCGITCILTFVTLRHFFLYPGHEATDSTSGAPLAANDNTAAPLNPNTEELEDLLDNAPKENSTEQNVKTVATAADGIVLPTPSSQVFTNLFLPPPPTLQLEPVPAQELRIQLTPTKVKWESRTLKIEFALQYIKNDLRHQQGHILIVARGPGLLMTHPSSALGLARAAYWIQPNMGEPFSVSRFREVKTEFGPLPAHQSLTALEIFIFNKTGNQLLIYQQHAIPAGS